MPNYVDFTIFNDKTLGEKFFPEGLCYGKNLTLIPTLIHGRSVAVKVDDYEWILVKGGGWNYQGPTIYVSTKDEELVFGLNPLKACIREYDVSKELEKISNDFPKVLYYRRFLEYELPEKYDFLKTIRYTSGELVDPALLYTKVKYPYRVADLMYLTDQEKNILVDECCRYFNIDSDAYVEAFARKLANNVALMHKNGFMDDTLEFSNITLLAEIVDYELVTAPGVPLFGGMYDTWRVDERKEKELLYGAEIVLQLSHFLNKKWDFYSCYSLFVDEYKKTNPDFTNRQRIVGVLEKKDFIL